MSTDKVKVKDLANELKKDPKEVLIAAQELGIVAAKIGNSNLSDSEAAKLRNHFNPSADTNNVIVRRRKAEPQAAAVEVEAVVAEPSAEVEEKQVKKAEKPPKVTKAKKVEPVAARIIQSVAKEQPQEKTVEQVLEAPELEVSTATPVAKVSSPALEQENNVASVKVVPETKTNEEPAKTTSKEHKPAKKAEPQVQAFAKVVRPAVFSAEPERNSSGQTVSSAPAMVSKTEEGDYRTNTYDGGNEQGQDTGNRVRVISRPEADSARNPRNTQRDEQGTARYQPQGQRAPRPQNDNRPPRPADGNRPPRPADGTRPPRPADGNRPPRPADGTRPPRPTDGTRPPRPTDGTRPPRPADGTRPAYNQGARPTNAPSPDVNRFMPPVETEQGRKKRNKGRRTVDFSSNTRVDMDDAGWSKSTRRKSRKPREVAPLGGTVPMKATKRVIKMDEFIRVAELAHQLAVKSGEVIKVLFGLGVMATINQSLDVDTTALVAQEFGYEVEKSGFFEEEIVLAQQETDKEEDLLPRPPVVTIMGHVDHGKTSLLDAIRTTSVVSGEAGGITQHIGAYHVTTAKGDIVFLDTPGHEAFTAMRSRGAEVTDIVVLVVAADDGVMEQTKEAISHAKAANVPIMVAVNKMDKPEANPDRVKRELSEQGIVAEDWGGDTTFSYVSAKTREGLDELLELLALQAEILELKANPNKPAVGHIVEAKLDKGRGALGTVLIQQGTLRLGDSFVCGVHSGRVRAMFNDQGKKVKEAGPSMPVEVQGFEGVPEAGENFICIADEKTARRIANARAIKQREKDLAKESKVTLETFLARKSDDVEAVVLNLVVKADVQGSLEAINDALRKMSTEKVRINLMHGGTGAISESDVLLAAASNAIIIGFNVRPTSKGKELAESEKVDIRFYDIIYKLVEEIKNAMEGMLAPVSKEVFLGTAEVRETFSVPKIGLVAGCHVSDGKMVRNALARLLRDGVVVHSGKLGSLRRFKDDMREVAKGYECGIGLENYNDIKIGDIIEAYEIVEEAAKL